MLTGMFFSPRITTKELAGLCRRLATSLVAGLDIRSVWNREAGSAARRATRARFRIVSRAVADGESLAEALAATGDFFPPLFRELAVVGDEAGRLGEVFAQLADHYQAQLKRQRIFLAAIAWPMVQLVAAICVVGFLIWIMGVLPTRGGTPIDILGFGLVGNSGLATYAAFLSGVGIVLVLIIRAVQRGLVWTRPIQRAALRVPVLGKALETLLLGRMAWSLHLTLNTAMDVRRAVRLSLQSTHNARYTDQIPAVEASISAGMSLFDTLARTECFPADFLETLHVGEQSGKLVESMAHLSRQYQDRAAVALGVLTMLAGFAVWCMVAAVIIALIVRLFMFYVGTINEALKM
jgi:type IV pilus assembly protein PilC